MVVFPNAKINIGLQVHDRRSDGYHNLSSIFYPVKGLCDVLEIVENQKNNHDNFHYSGLSIPGKGEKNLIYRAIEGLRESYSFPSVNVYLHKVIPMGAGLGGGSSDGTFTLKLINDLFNLKLGVREIEERALRLGSDCPFFIDNQPVKASGRGEKLDRVELTLNGFFITLAFSEFHISTSEAYKNVELDQRSAHELNSLSEVEIVNWKESITNGFEKFALRKYPDLAKVKAYLYKNDALYCSMTGSGSAIYGIFEKLPKNLKLNGFTFWSGAL